MIRKQNSPSTLFQSGSAKEAEEADLSLHCDRDGCMDRHNYQSFGICELLPFNRSSKRYPAKPGMQDSLSSGVCYYPSFLGCTK